MAEDMTPIDLLSCDAAQAAIAGLWHTLDRAARAKGVVTVQLCLGIYGLREDESHISTAIVGDAADDITADVATALLEASGATDGAVRHITRLV